MIALVAALLLQQPPAVAPRAATAAEIPLQMGVSVRPETVTVGDPFLVSVRVRAPRGATLAFPAPPDTSGPVQALDQTVIRPGSDASVTEQTAMFRLAAWDVDTLTVRLGEIAVRVGNAERRAEIPAVRVVVRSVLPADSALRVPKPARPPFDLPVSWWWLWALIAAGALLIALLGWWLWRRWRRRRAGRGEPELDPYELAHREFDRIEALGLLEAGERGRFVALMVDVLRDYLARRVAAANLSLTSTELLGAVRSARVVPSARLAPLLAEADLVKFARRPLTPERAREMAKEARAIVEEVERADAAARGAWA